MELSSPKIKKVLILIFSQKKSFSYILGNGNFFKKKYFWRQFCEFEK